MGIRKNIKPYKSKYEFNQAERLEKNGINFQYEACQFSYEVPTKNSVCHRCDSTDIYIIRSYTPDFWFPKSKIFVETKGKFTSDNRTRMANICAQTSSEVRMVFMHDNWLSKKHSMRYSRWCELHDIEYAIGNIPLSWVEKDVQE